MKKPYNAITIGDIQDALNKIYEASNKLKYEGKYYLAFVVNLIWADRETGYVLRGDYCIDGKPVILLQLEGEIHKRIVEAEKKYEIHIDRITQEMAQKMYQKLPIGYVDEDGKPFDLKLEPFELPVLSDGEPLFNPSRYIIR